MNKRGFTLIELLVVVAIMGLMGTAAVGGYRQFQRGMEERGVLENVSQFLKVASERAQIDRQPTAVYCWNELLREATEDDTAIVVGKAVAIRRGGRLTDRQGEYLIDEFGDLEQFDENGDLVKTKTSGRQKLTRRLYRLNNLSGSSDIKYSIVGSDAEYALQRQESYLFSKPENMGSDNGRLHLFGYRVYGGESAGSWKAGDAYGFEFQTLELPHGYVFGQNIPTSMGSPVTEGVVIVYDASVGNSSGAAVGSSTLSVCSLRPNASGQVTPQSIGTVKIPDAQLNN